MAAIVAVACTLQECRNSVSVLWDIVQQALADLEDLAEHKGCLLAAQVLESAEQTGRLALREMDVGRS